MTIDEVLVNETFITKVTDQISKLRHQRAKRPQPRAGFRYKKDWFDRMEPLGQVNAQYFLDNIEDIWLKISGLSALERGVIASVCDRALFETANKIES
jgi:hypothetical protein